MKPTDLITKEPFKSLFPINETVLGAITETMKTTGFDSATPIIVWKGRNIVLDGHTRLAAALAAGIKDVLVVERDFPSEDEAVRYAIHCQRNRRNLTDADIVRLVQELDKRRRQGERTDLAQGCAKSGKSASDTAGALGVSTRKVEQARSVIDKAAPEVKQAVVAGKMSINAAVKTVSTKTKAADNPSPKDEYHLVLELLKKISERDNGFRVLNSVMHWCARLAGKKIMALDFVWIAKRDRKSFSAWHKGGK